MTDIMVDIPPTILLRSGRYFNLLKPNEPVAIEDIAHALSNICRFGGHVSKFYSVAQHSVHVSYLTCSLEGLLHDAAEAFIGDVTSPLKQLLPQYKEIEKQIEKFLFKQFELSYPMSAAVKRADLMMLATEQAQLLPRHGNDDVEWEIIRGIKPVPNLHIVPLKPELAYARFMDRYEQLA